MPTVGVRDTKTGKTGTVDFEDGTPLAEIEAQVRGDGLELNVQTVRVQSEDGSPVDYPFPADMPAQAVIEDLAQKGWTIAQPSTGSATPRGPVGVAPVAGDEANQLNMEGLSEGAQEMFRDAGNVALRPFMDPAEYAQRIVEQARERKAKLESIASRTANLEATGGATAYPNAARMAPRALAEAGTEYALTRSTRSALARIAAGGVVAGGFEVLDQTDRSFIESLGTGGAQGFGVGVAASALGEAVPSAKRWLGKALTEALEARGIPLRPDANPFHLDALQPDLGNRPASEVAGIPLTPAQALAPDDALAQMYQAASRRPGGPREQLEVRQAEATRALFADTARRYLPDALVPNGVFDRSAGTTAVGLATRRYEELKRDMMGQVSQRFRNTLWPALVRSGASPQAGSGIITGGAAVLPGSEYLRTLRAIATQAQETGLAADKLVPLEQEIKRIEDAGGWTVGGFQNRLMIEGRRAFGGGSNGDSWMDLGTTFEPRTMYNAMQRDLDKAIALGDPNVALVGGAGAPNRQAYTGTRPGMGGAPGAQPGEGDALANLQAWQGSGGAGAGPGFVGDLPGAPAGPQAPSAPGRSTPPRNPMAQSDPSFDPHEDAYRAMDEAALSRFRAVGNTRAAAQAVRSAREGFARDMEVMQEINGSAMNRMLGDPDSSKTADQYREEFMAAKPDQKVEQMRFLDQHAPQAANYLRGAMFQSVVDEARAARTATHGDADTVEIGAFARAFGSLQRGEMEALLPAGMSEAQRQKVLAGMLTMETLVAAQGADAVGKAMQFVPRMRGAAINVVLQNLGFIASFLTGDFTPGMLERSLYREEGIRGWMRLSEAKPGSAAAASAMASIADQMWIAEKDAEEIAARAAIMAAEADARQSGTGQGQF